MFGCRTLEVLRVAVADLLRTTCGQLLALVPPLVRPSTAAPLPSFPLQWSIQREFRSSHSPQACRSDWRAVATRTAESRCRWTGSGAPSATWTGTARTRGCSARCSDTWTGSAGEFTTVRRDCECLDLCALFSTERQSVCQPSPKRKRVCFCETHETF